MAAKPGFKQHCDKCNKEIGTYGFKKHYSVCRGIVNKRTIRFSPGGWNKGLTKQTTPSLNHGRGLLLDQWYKGELEITFSNTANARRCFKEYLIQKLGPDCCLCGFKAKHPDDDKWVIELDHIDGNANNNTPSNLRLICPNCHAMTSTSSGRNKKLKNKAAIA